MASRQLYESEKGETEAYNDSELSLRDSAEKLNRRCSSTDVFLKNNKKTGNYLQKERRDRKRKNTASEDTSSAASQLFNQLSVFFAQYCSKQRA